MLGNTYAEGHVVMSLQVCVCMYVHVCVHTTELCTCRDQKKVDRGHHVGPMAWIQVSRFDRRHLYPLSHLKRYSLCPEVLPPLLPP